MQCNCSYNQRLAAVPSGIFQDKNNNPIGTLMIKGLGFKCFEKGLDIHQVIKMKQQSKEFPIKIDDSGQYRLKVDRKFYSQALVEMGIVGVNWYFFFLENLAPILQFYLTNQNMIAFFKNYH